MIQSAPHPDTGFVTIDPEQWPVVQDSRDQLEWIAATLAFGVDPNDLTNAGRPPRITIHDVFDHATLDADVFDRDAAGRLRVAEEHLSIAIRTIRVSTTATAVREAIANA